VNTLARDAPEIYTVMTLALLSKGIRSSSKRDNDIMKFFLHRS
jgi:hypothetical protein